MSCKFHVDAFLFRDGSKRFTHTIKEGKITPDLHLTVKARSSMSPIKTQTKLVPYEDSDSEEELLEVDPYYEKQKKTITFKRCYACSKGLGEHTHEIGTFAQIPILRSRK